MWERRGDGMTAFKTAMNNYQSFLQTNTNEFSERRAHADRGSIITMLRFLTEAFLANF
jgi:hypothetical protein